MRLACSKKGFTLLETLVTVGIFIVLIAIGSFFVSVYFSQEQHQSALATIDDALLYARTQTISGADGVPWEIVMAANAITVQTESGASPRVYVLPESSLLNWSGASTRTLTQPNGFIDEVWNFSVTTGSRTTGMTLNIYGILSTE